MEDLLINAGLTMPQAEIYLYLLKHGESAPPVVAKALNLTRSNAYKVLDSLAEVDLVTKHEASKKFVYRAADPTALASLVADKRNAVIALEKNISAAMKQLRSNYNKHYGSVTAATHHGKQHMLEAYSQQVEQQQDIYFVKSRADIPFMGYETMNKVRHLASRYPSRRYGITPDGPESATNDTIDARSKLTRTWTPIDSYTAPVEWSVSGDSLIMQVFDKNGRVIVVRDQVVAEAFKQVWQLLDESLRLRPDYAQLPRSARRNT